MRCYNQVIYSDDIHTHSVQLAYKVARFVCKHFCSELSITVMHSPCLPPALLLYTLRLCHYALRTMLIFCLDCCSYLLYFPCLALKALLLLHFALISLWIYQFLIYNNSWTPWNQGSMELINIDQTNKYSELFLGPNEILKILKKHSTEKYYYH